MIRIEGTAEWVDMGVEDGTITDDGIRYLICEKAAHPGVNGCVTGKKQSYLDS